MSNLLEVDFQMARAVWRRNFITYRRTWKLNILPNFFEPVLYMLGMGVGLGAYLGEDIGGIPYVAWIAPGLMAASAMNGATFETTYNVFIKMHFARIYDAILGTPAQIQDIVIGELLWAVTRGFAYGFAFLLVVASMPLFGVVVLQNWWSLALPFAFVIIAWLFAALGALFTAYVKRIDLYSYYYTLFMTPLFLFSGIFFPVDTFPAGASVAWFTPLYHAVRLCRALVQGEVTASAWISLAWLLVVTVVLTAIVPIQMRRKLRK